MADDSSTTGTPGHHAMLGTNETLEGIGLEVADLVRRFKLKGAWGRARPVIRAVDGVSLSIPPGRTLGLIGESGCGKSTLANLIVGAISPDSGTIMAGEHILASHRSLDDRRLIQMVFQDPYSSLNPRHKVGDSVKEPLLVQGLFRRYGGDDYVDSLFERIGLHPRDREKYPGEFSGGQRQRVAIARAIATRPRIVVLDEPVSALDVSVRAQILLLLLDLQRELSLTYLFIGHDLPVVEQISDQVAVMYLGKLVETRPASDIFANPAHPYTQALVDAMPSRTTDATSPPRMLTGEVPSPIAPPSGCRFRTRCWKADTICAELEPPFEEGTACHFPIGSTR